MRGFKPCVGLPFLSLERQWHPTQYRGRAAVVAPQGHQAPSVAHGLAGTNTRLLPRD